MSKILLIILIIASVLIGITAFVLIGFWARFKIDEKARRNCESLVDYTIDFIKQNLGFIRVISGQIRSGKSTMTAGITHADQIIIRDTALEKIKYTRSIMHDVDWVSIDKDIEEQHTLTSDRFKTFRLLKEKYASQFDDKEYDNHLKVIPYLKLLDDYIYAYFRLLDNNFVLSNIDCYSHITETNSLRFDSSYMKIKELVTFSDTKVVSTKYPILRYMTIFEDEKLLGEKTNLNLNDKYNDDGSPAFLRLQGQLGKETIFFNTTAQNALRIIKTERELATSILYIKGYEIIGNLPFKSWIYNKKLKRNDNKEQKYAFKHFKHDEEDYNNYLKSDNQFKQKHMKYKDVLNEIFSESYICYHCIIYRNIDDVGKSLSEAHGAIEFDFVFPVKWCFGSIDSHYYSFLQDILEGEGRSPYYDLLKQAAETPLSDFEKSRILLKKHEGKKKEEKKDETKAKEPAGTTA